MPSTTPLTFSSTASATALSPANASSVNLQLLKKKEIEDSDNKVLLIMYNTPTIIPSTIDSTVFASPKSLAWNNSIDYKHTAQPINKYQTESFGIKVFAYLNITKAQNYMMNYTGNNSLAKIYLNNYLILDNSSGSNDGIKLYLKSGSYIFYAEIFHRPILSGPSNAMPSYSASYFYLLPNGIQTAGEDVSLNQYLHPTLNFTMLNNISTIRKNSYQNYCTTETNLTTTANICDNSLTTEDILNDQVMGMCFNSSGSPFIDTLDNTKLKSSCKNIYNKTNLNSTIKSNLNTKYDSWAKLGLNDSTNDNYLIDYIDFRKPSITDLPLTDAFLSYCENQNLGLYTPSSDKSKVCDAIYNKNKISLDTSSATKINNSKQNIKTRYCSVADTTGNLTNIKTDNCKTELIGNDKLSTAVTNFCFPNNIINKGTDQLMNSVCTENIRNLPSLNATIAKNYDDKYKAWATSAISNSQYAGADDIALNEYIKSKKPTSADLFGTAGPSAKLVGYCEGQIGDTYEADSTKAINNLCHNLYTNSTYNTNTNIKNSINNRKKSYCLKIVDNKPRYETDASCKKIETDLLNETIKTRCVPSTGYNIDDNYCNTLANDNITMTTDPYKTLNNSRTSLLQTQIAGLSPDTTPYTNSKMLNDNLYNYAIGKYNDNPSKKLSDELLNQKLFDYCENKDNNFTANAAGQCYGIYNKFKTDANVIASRNRMRDELCQLPENITSNNNDDYKTNIFKCKDLTFGSVNNDIMKFSTAINGFCAVNNNISSQNCIDYYNNIENRVLNQLNIQSKSAFQNKNLTQYKNIEYESFNNESEEMADIDPLTTSNSELVGIDNTLVGIDNSSVGIDNSSVSIDNTSVGVNNSSVGANNTSVGVNNTSVDVNNILVDVDNSGVYDDLLIDDTILDNSNEEYNEDTYESNDNIVFILLWFIFIVLLITALGMCMNKSQKKSNSNNDSNNNTNNDTKIMMS